MSMTYGHPIAAIATYHPLPQRMWAGLKEAWAEWRAASLHRARLKVLQGLSDATLHDIGLAEQVPARDTLSLLDYERARW
jgi:hypothetical protein